MDHPLGLLCLHGDCIFGLYALTALGLSVPGSRGPRRTKQRHLEIKGGDVGETWRDAFRGLGLFGVKGQTEGTDMNRLRMTV